MSRCERSQIGVQHVSSTSACGLLSFLPCLCCVVMNFSFFHMESLAPSVSEICTKRQAAWRGLLQADGRLCRWGGGISGNESCVPLYEG